ncbi:MAG TPA: adenylate/guanylate cyclase domain-containing protein [Acidimicrobiia bacterium]|jgi:adenylate cyclase
MRRRGAQAERLEVMRRLFWRCGAICTFANLAGALFVFVFLIAIAPGDRLGSWLPYAIAFVVYAAIAFPLEAWWSMRSWDRVLGWAAEDRPPAPAEQEATLRLPLSEAARSLVAWVIASVVFAVMCFVIDGRSGLAVRVGLTIFDGGLVTCAVVFLFFERALRPIFARALATDPPRRRMSIGVRPRLLLTWTLGSAVPFAGLVALPMTTGAHADIAAAVVTLSLVGLIVGLVTTLVAARSVADPLELLQTAIARVADGQLDVSVAVDDGGEVGQLQAGVNHMVSGLRERRRLADLFGRHVGTEVARLALEQGSGLMSEQRDVTAMFVDLVGSTALAEVLAPEQVVDTLNAFFGAVATAVAAEGGWVNKFEGDGALCVFGAPAAQPDHAPRALRAARSLRERLAELAASYPGMDAGIGVSSGAVVAGNVGTEARYEYTVIGGPVNEAARLTELAKERPGRVIASGGALERARDEATHWTPLGTVALRGRSTPTPIYEPVPARAVVELP